METGKWIKAVARRKAFAAKDDYQEMWKDLEQVGWVGYLEHPKLDEKGKLLAAQSKMTLYLRSWTYNRVHALKGPEQPLVGIEARDQIDPRPSIEEQVYGIQLLKGIEGKIARARNNTHLVGAMEGMILDDGHPRFGTRAGRAEQRAKERVRKLVKGLF